MAEARLWGYMEFARNLVTSCTLFALLDMGSCSCTKSVDVACARNTQGVGTAPF